MKELGVAETSSWVRLLALDAREVVLGPFQENVQVELYDQGFRVGRKGILGSVDSQAGVWFRFSQLDLDEKGSGVVIHPVDESASPRRFAGTGGRLLRELVKILGLDGVGPIMALPGATVARLGVVIRGTVVGGPRGVLLIPDGIFGLLSGAVVRLSISALTGVMATSEGLAVYARGFDEPVLRLFGRPEIMARFGDWWARSMVIDAKRRAAKRLAIVWQDDEGVMSPGEVELLVGGIGLISTDGQERKFQSAGLHVVLEDSREYVPGAVRCTMRVRGRLHTVWFPGGEPQARQFASHLRTHSLAVWRNDLEPEPWKSCRGRWSAIRLIAPGDAEVVLRKVVSTIDSTGIQLFVEEVSDNFEALGLGGRHVQMVMLHGRNTVGVQAIHLGSWFKPDAASGAPHTIRFYPLGEGPERMPSRRSQFRLEIEEPVAVELRHEADEVRLMGRLENLSAAGAAVCVPRGHGLLGSMILFRLPLLTGGRIQVRGEVLHVRKRRDGDSDIGVRFVMANERVRTRFQQEVLRYERRTMQENESTIDDTPVLAVPHSEQAWGEEDTIDLA